ncbi:MAG: ATP-dependent Clp protease ATP-binding subunit ClpC1 [Acidobacteria bacterium]|nr:ATP-dependent Clp protease ATP-binding subunit ClpC1 [Acidobacteriota bacterium]
MQALDELIIGQEYAIAALTRAVTLALADRRYTDSNRPLAVFMFAGPVGAGKINAAQSLAQVLFGDERKVTYVNCQSLNQPSDSLSNSPSGLYQLSNLHEQLVAGSVITRMISPFNSSPFSVLVFERIDKAPQSFRDQLAIAIDRGVLYTLGSVFSLRNTFIILTSDLSKKQTDQLVGRTIGFFRDEESGAEEDEPRQHLVVLEEIDNLLGSNLVNRIDEIVIFERLNERNVITLLERKLAEINRMMAASGIGFKIEEDAKTFLIRHCLDDPTHRVRQIKRVLRNYLEFPLSDLMLSRQLAPGTAVLVKHEPPRNFLNFRVMIPRLPPEAHSMLPLPPRIGT